MTSCSTADSYGCNFTCPNGGSWTVCSSSSPTKFFGCCAIDPCESQIGCPSNSLYPASFNPNLYNNISHNDCIGSNNSYWWSCTYQSGPLQGNTPFLGCCLDNPCTLGDCPSGSLIAAAWISTAPANFPNQYSLFLDGGSTGSSAVSTTSASSSTTSAISAMATSASTSTSAASSTATLQPSSSGLSKGAIAGIVVGAVVVLLVIVGLIGLVMYQRGLISGSKPRVSVPDDSPALATKQVENLVPKHRSSMFTLVFQKKSILTCLVAAPSYATTQSSPRSTLPPYPSSPNSQAPDVERQASLASGLGIARGPITYDPIHELESTETGRRHELWG